MAKYVLKIINICVFTTMFFIFFLPVSFIFHIFFDPMKLKRGGIKLNSYLRKSHG